MIPKKLKKEPIIEALWELRFETEPNFVEIIPGMLFSHLKNRYSSLVIKKLPTNFIPSEIREIDPNLKYAPSVRIEAMNAPFIWQVGERVFTFNNKRPYAGWNKFLEEIKFLSETFEKLNLFKSVEKISLRYIDLIENEILHDLSGLRVAINIEEWKVKDERVSLLVEKVDDKFKYIIQIVRPINIVIESRMAGTIIDIEVELIDRNNSISELINRYINTMHDKIKEIFFRWILSNEIISKLEPEW